MADTPTRFRSLDALPADDGTPERMYLLVIDDGAGQPYTLPVQGTLILGSAPDADIHIRDPLVAGHHVRLSAGGGEVRLLDLGSGGETLVNRERVPDARRLRSGDVVTLGSTTIVLLRELRPARPGKIALAAETTVEYSIAGHTVAAAEPAMLRVFDLLRRLAACDLPVLVLGETGTGKEHAAAALHDWSARRERRLVCINCAAIPETLIESELFGYERGAFSGARSTKLGLLEQASGGTVFLDEVAELGPGAQAKLLRALDTKRITHLGDVRERALDIRIVAATNRDLEAESRAGRFRQDLLFRLGAAVVVVPPLRHRLRELPILSRLFVAEACARAGRPGLEISESTLYQLAAYGWPGNVRELRNALEFAVATAEGATIEPWNLPDRISGRTVAASPEAITTAAAATSVAPRRYRPIAEELRELERTRMQEALEDAGGVQTRAAELISMPIRTFALKLKQYGISARDVKRRQE